MTTPASVPAECPACKCETLHEVLSGRFGGKATSVLDSTVKCKECGHVHHVVVKTPKPVQVPVIVSWLDKSARDMVVLGPDEVISVGDEIMCGEVPTMVTSIESGGARVRSCKAGAADTIWAKKFDKVRVPLSVNNRGRTMAEHVMAAPDEEFHVGDMIEVNQRPVVIHAIKVPERTLRRGSAVSRDIVRLYGNMVRKTVQRGGRGSKG